MPLNTQIGCQTMDYSLSQRLLYTSLCVD